MIKVFTIDDSLLIQRYLKKIIDSLDDIELIGSALNPIAAKDDLEKLNPDVIILDLEMPKMDGLTYLKEREDNTPTLMFSSYIESGSSNALKTLRYGACEIIQKNQTTLQFNDEIVKEFERKIKATAKSKSIQHIIDKAEAKQTKLHTPTIKSSYTIVAIGASTGGVETLETILTKLNKDHAPILITQHMPAGFTTSFAARLNKICSNSNIVEAKGGESIGLGDIFIAPGDKHLEIEQSGINSYKTLLQDYPKVSNHKPSVDVLFTSFANEAANKTIAFILTGMGQDGVKGLNKILNSGGHTYGQDEKSSVVYGMPKAAYEAGAVQTQVSLLDVANIINKI